MFFLWSNSPNRASATWFLWLLVLTRTDTHSDPVGLSLSEWSAHCRGRYLHNTRKSRTCMPSPGFFFRSLCTLSVILCSDCPGFGFCPHCTTYTTQISIPPASDWPHTLALDRSATAIGGGFEPAMSATERPQTYYLRSHGHQNLLLVVLASSCPSSWSRPTLTETWYWGLLRKSSDAFRF
jgi:hypothetical protein